MTSIFYMVKTMSPIEEKLHSALDAVTEESTRDRFIEYLDVLLENKKENQIWNNNDIESYLKGIRYIASNLDIYYDGPGEAKGKIIDPAWQLFAEVLFGARCARDDKPA